MMPPPDQNETIPSPAPEPSSTEDGRGRYREVKMHLDIDTLGRIERVRQAHGLGGRGAAVDHALAVALGETPPDDRRGAGKAGVSRWTRYRRAKRQAEADAE